jgi:hypothetical protein
MIRWMHALLLTGVGATLGFLATASAQPADKPETPAKPGAAQTHEEGDVDPGRRIDKAIAAYENRADQELDQVRKEITRLRKELSDLSELQNDLAMSLAEIQAEIRVLAATRPQGGGDDAGPGSASASAISPQERQRLRCTELARELRQVQENLRALVQQKRTETDQVVIQLRSLRGQQRQMTAAAAQSAQVEKPSKD